MVKLSRFFTKKPSRYIVLYYGSLPGSSVVTAQGKLDMTAKDAADAIAKAQEWMEGWLGGYEVMFFAASWPKYVLLWPLFKIRRMV